MSGVLVVGPLRSGSNMVAGIFAKHGVFFGDCKPADELNPRGCFENVWLWEAFKRKPEPWPDVWFERLEREGWDGNQPWGAKISPSPRKRRELMRRTNPRVVVLCERPPEQIRASRRRGYKATGNPLRGSLDVSAMDCQADSPVTSIDTDKLVAGGERGRIACALALLGLRLNERVVDDWIDPNLWNRSKIDG